MDEAGLCRLIPRTYALQGLQNIRNRDNLFNNIILHQRLLDDGIDDQTIEYIITQLSMMDSNSFHDKAGVGEREGRVFSSLVAKRHFGFSHGIGRSGDIAEVQPKAAGSSVLYKLTNKLVAHALNIAGIKTPMQCIVFPLATGMTIATTLLTMKAASPGKNKVIWCRIDQKSCLKAIGMVGLTPIVVDPVLQDNVLVTDSTRIQEILSSEQGQDILAVITTTSCFAPRQPDRIDIVAELCNTFNVFHLVNNAYGLQCTKISKLIDRAFLKGRVDAVIQSTDKNFLVPVGGAILASRNDAFLAKVAANYPGRASAAPILDMFITLLSMGKTGYQQLLQQRQQLLPTFRQRLSDLCTQEGFEILQSPANTISFAISLGSLVTNDGKDLSFLGSMLFQRNVSGCRVVVSSATNGKQSKVAGIDFVNWGAHSDCYPVSYFTVACAVGMTESEVEVFLSKLKKTVTKFRKLRSLTVEESG